MKQIFILTLVVSLPLTAFPESRPDAGNLVPTNDIIVSCGAATDLGWAKHNQQFYCLGQTKTGYSILVQTNGKTNVGFIPFRDEWGHAVADTREHDTVLQKNMILIKTPVKIEAGRIVLEKGKRYPIAAAEKDAFAVRYETEGFSTTVMISRAEVTFVATTDIAVPPVELKPEDTMAASKVPPAVRMKLVKLIEKPAEPKEKEIADQTLAAAAVKVDEEKTQATQPDPALEIPKIKHAAVGAKITVSSTHTGEAGEGPPEALVDGDLQTRWSSEYSEPQEVVVELATEQKLGKLRLHWEVAAAVNYNVLVSADGKEWTKPQTMTGGKIGPRVDELDMRNAPAKFIKLELLNRIHDTWGFSLYEIEVVSQE